MSRLTIEMNLSDFVKEVSKALDDLTRGGCPRCPPPTSFTELVAGALFHDWMHHFRLGQKRSGVVYAISEVWGRKNVSLVAELLDEPTPTKHQQIMILMAIKHYFEDRMMRAKARQSGLSDLLGELDQLAGQEDISEKTFKRIFAEVGAFLCLLDNNEYRKAISELRTYGDDFDRPPIARWLEGLEAPTHALRQHAVRRVIGHLIKHYR